MTIQRYTGENVEFHTTGDLVAYEDYAELKEEYERLDNTHSAALAKIDALAAENAALKISRAEILKDLDDTCFEIGMMRGEKLASYTDMETPATDAILASLRAEGVEMFAYYISLYNSDAERHAHSFAAQLRSKSEVQS